VISKKKPLSVLLWVTNSTQASLSYEGDLDVFGLWNWKTQGKNEALVLWEIRIRLLCLSRSSPLFMSFFSLSPYHPHICFPLIILSQADTSWFPLWLLSNSVTKSLLSTKDFNY
jgi:hypothetical protein